MAVEAADTYDRSRHFFAQAVGLGRGTLRTYQFLAVLGVTAGLAGSGWAVVATKKAEDSVQRYIVYVDSNTNVVGTMPVNTSQDVPDGAFVDFAQRWITTMRARPKHEKTLIENRKFVIRTTDKRLYTALHESLCAADDLLKTSEVEVQEVGGNLIGREG